MCICMILKYLQPVSKPNLHCCIWGYTAVWQHKRNAGCVKGSMKHSGSDKGVCHSWKSVFIRPASSLLTAASHITLSVTHGGHWRITPTQQPLCTQQRVTKSHTHTHFWHIHGIEIKWLWGDREINMRMGHASLKLKFKILWKREEGCKVPRLVFLHANKELFWDFQQSGYVHQGETIWLSK